MLTYGDIVIEGNRALYNIAVLSGEAKIASRLLFKKNDGSFYISGSHVTFFNRVTFKMGKSDQGGAITIISSTVVFKDFVTFCNNTSGEDGGAVYAAWSTVVVQKSIEFIGNTAKKVEVEYGFIQVDLNVYIFVIFQIIEH